MLVDVSPNAREYLEIKTVNDLFNFFSEALSRVNSERGYAPELAGMSSAFQMYRTFVQSRWKVWGQCAGCGGAVTTLPNGLQKCGEKESCGYEECPQCNGVVENGRCISCGGEV